MMSEALQLTVIVMRGGKGTRVRGLCQGTRVRGLCDSCQGTL